MPLVFASIVPHPPILIPELGKGEEKKISKTAAAIGKIAAELSQSEPDLIIFISPHTLIYRDRFNICAMPNLQGSLAQFGASSVAWQGKNDLLFVSDITKECEKEDIPILLYENEEKYYELDHGILVPLSFIAEEMTSGYEILPIGYSYLPPEEHYRFGQALAKVCAKSHRRVALIASGDLSHRLLQTAPSGFSYRGKEFDEKIYLYYKRKKS